MLALAVVITGCKKDEPTSNTFVDPCVAANQNLNTTLTLNSIDYQFNAEASINPNYDPALYLTYERCTDGLVNHLGVYRVPLHSGAYGFRYASPDTLSSVGLYYMKVDYDVITAWYHPYGPDSASNQIQVVVDSLAKQISVQFQGTLVNETEPYDTLHVTDPGSTMTWE
jgi:hypothetical protein